MGHDPTSFVRHVESPQLPFEKPPRVTLFGSWYYMTLGQQMGMKSYFCAPQAPWQKGTVENTNGRLRRFLPLDTDLARRTAEDLAALAHRMNTTPRKCLDFKTPAEVFEAFVTNAPDAP